MARSSSADAHSVSDGSQGAFAVNVCFHFLRLDKNNTKVCSIELLLSLVI